MSNTTQKNQSTHFGNPFPEGGTPQKQLDSFEQIPSHVLRERNRKSDIFNRDLQQEGEQEGKEEPEIAKPIRSNDAENDSAAATFKNRNGSSSIFGDETQHPQQPQQPPSPCAKTPQKISNIF